MFFSRLFLVENQKNGHITNGRTKLCIEIFELRKTEQGVKLLGQAVVTSYLHVF